MQSQHRRCVLINFYHLNKCSSIVFILTVCYSSLLLGSAQGDDYLKEAPSFLMPCAISDPNNGVCLGKAVENVFTNWKNGIPGLKSLGSIDPIHIKKWNFVQHNQNINLRLDLKGMEIKGLSTAKVTNATIRDEYNFKIYVTIPSLRANAKSHAKGTILLLNLDSNGSLEIELSGLEVLFSLKTKLIKIHNQKFFDISSTKTSIKNIANFGINFGNLFNDSGDVAEIANAVFNENWQDFFEVMRPSIEDILNTVIMDHYKKIFSYVPANYFFIDLN